ncbi:kelch repeat and BTB domain-containing protein 12 isoform X2 [Tetranychus urticae]|uniref:kelch repeat and BTB domain-containing protein 12 isoform X2 n=1 Tax=Tetranychus urticae TaxID=32264 RepID=UPI00077BE4E8|nr:kelch repeat and BTB domain-containing protein 12 isoform X2 [Tetranychus urticae]
MEIQEDASSLLLRAYKTGKWSDITIMNGDKKYRVHKLILSDVIPYFDRMFSSGLSESTSQLIELDHPPHVFDLIIEWAYCSKIKITKENAVDLFHLADYMNIPKLTALCLDFLWNESSDSPYIDVGHWINQIATEEVLKSIDQYIRSNFRDIVHTNSFLDYDVDTVTYMINLDNLNIDNEMQIFDAIMRWIRKNVERRSQLTKMLKIVHWVDINGVQFMDKIDKSWIMDCDPARHVIMAALELSFFKSLKTIQINDVHFGPRNKSDGFHYAVYRNNDSSIDFHHFDRKYESINLSENPFLPAANFGDSNITEHIFDSDAVIRIDWKHKNYRLFKDSDCCYTLLFGRLFQCNKEEKKIHFWKGDRLIEFDYLFLDQLDGQSTLKTLTKHEGEFLLSAITTAPKRNQVRHCYQNAEGYKLLTVEKNNGDFFASHEIFTKKPIKMLKSTTFHDLLVIFVDCTLILTYDFNKNTFKEYKNSEMEHMCCLYFHSTGSELWIFFNESESGYDKTIMQVFRVEDGQLIPVPVSHNPICSIVTDCKMIGLISLEAKH